MACLNIGNGFLCYNDKINFNCPHCKKEYIDSKEIYLNRINRNKKLSTIVKCDCGSKFYLSYDYLGNFVTGK